MEITILNRQIDKYRANDAIHTLAINYVLLVKIEGPVWYTIYHHLPAEWGQTYPSINQPNNRKRTSIIATDSYSMFG